MVYNLIGYSIQIQRLYYFSAPGKVGNRLVLCLHVLAVFPALKNWAKLGMVAHTYNPRLGRLRQEDHKFKASLGYTVTSSQPGTQRRDLNSGLWNLGFLLTKQALYCLSHTFSPFWSGYFGDRVSRTICLRWPQTSILPISASQVARVTGVRHRYPAQLFKKGILLMEAKEIRYGLRTS
jgi:hypothetical protein